MSYDIKGAIELMKSRGYEHTATNGASTILYFLKKRDHDLHIHATVFLETQKVDLDNTGLLDLGITIYCESIPIEYETFKDFEERLYNYTYLCVYGIQSSSIHTDSRNELHFKTEVGSKTFHSNRDPIGFIDPSSIGGEKEGKGKPSSKPSIKERKLKFWDEVKEVAKQKGYPKELAVAFYTYWSEANKSNTVFRREKENFFDIPKRFATWIKNDRIWSKKTFTEKSTEVQEEEIKSTNKNIIKHKDLF
jgi:hypothetical protein